VYYPPILNVCLVSPSVCHVLIYGRVFVRLIIVGRAFVDLLMISVEQRRGGLKPQQIVL
jgi:hypothetical protein